MHTLVIVAGVMAFVLLVVLVELAAALLPLVFVVLCATRAAPGASSAVGRGGQFAKAAPLACAPARRSGPQAGTGRKPLSVAGVGTLE